ncbi:MAG: variant-type mycofactocin precursor [Desulfobacterales bacterium]|nr:variant-type mycofactocin precursor [Desulfobacterales bacterium]
MEENKEIKETENESKDDDIFRIEEIKIEEMAIDGICGVY